MVSITIPGLDADELHIRPLANVCTIEDEARDILNSVLNNRKLLT